MQTYTKNKYLEKTIAFILPIILIVCWEVLVDTFSFASPNVTSPSAILRNLWLLIIDGDILLQTLYSIIRLMVGILLGLLFSLMSSYILYFHKKLDVFISPSLRFFAPIPIVIWIPFVIMIFGGGAIYKILLISLSTFLLIHINAFNSMKEIDKEFIELSNIYEKNNFQSYLNILFPYSLSTILTTLRINVAIAWIVLFITEYGSASQNSGGLGYFISYARQMGLVENQFSGVFILGGLSYLLDTIIRNIQAKSSLWMNLETN